MEFWRRLEGTCHVASCDRAWRCIPVTVHQTVGIMLSAYNFSEALPEAFVETVVDSFPRSVGSFMIGHSSLLARCEQLCGMSLSVIHSEEGEFISGIEMSLGGGLASEVAAELKSQTVSIIHHPEQDYWTFGLRVPGTNLRAGGVLLRDPHSLPEFMRESFRYADTSDELLQTWLKQHSSTRPELIERLLQSAHELMEHEQYREANDRSTTSIVGQLGKVYEEVVLIQDLAQYLRPDVDPLTLAEAVMERVRLISESNLSALCMRRGNTTDYQVSGEWGLSGEEIESLVREIQGDRSPQIIVRNHIQSSSLRFKYPTVHSLVAVPLFENEEIPSWLILANPADGRELGTEEANMVKSIGGVLSAHAQVVELFRRREEMVLSFIRSLVTTLDAKDSYTRGHSERVAMVAQRIAIEMNLSREEAEAIYQSGLLHDIGKIGVDDAVLHKQAALSPIEFRKIAKHPEIGHTIISELKNLSHILPGILHHHERYDGRGYPNKLAGVEIPLMARILAVADAFDAMGSDRPYRKGLGREEIEQVLLKGAGNQWDPDVVQSFLSARFEIYHLWSRAIERQAQES